MELMHWICIGAAVAVAATGWFLVVPLYRGWRPLNDRITDQVSRSAALVKECSTTMGAGTAFGRLSTIR
ncbi:hypothetical protein QTH90_03400 [Variovorax sp. J2P1-59]|uniref:hypothetical protein n=1 Tax=Variovorax flavidus TaxID=3053501 RepID=UPI0025752D2A|nr:hypothetical protein [Variovorax sp. J2P1-59]MDM0073410.1 hypothetical protein [Variovorax sp. J2P1-59]